MWKEWKWDSWKMDVCGTQAELCCRSGGGQRWEAAWWDNEQHLSPIKSLYLSPSSCTVTTCRHCFTIWWLHLSLHRLHLMKVVFCCGLLVQASLSRTHCLEKLLPLWQESPPGWAVSLFPGLLFWFCFRMALSSIFLSLLLNELTFPATVFWFCEKKKRKERAKLWQKNQTNILPGKTTLWYFELIALCLCTQGHHCSFTGLSQGCWDGGMEEREMPGVRCLLSGGL